MTPMTSVSRDAAKGPTTRGRRTLKRRHAAAREHRRPGPSSSTYPHSVGMKRAVAHQPLIPSPAAANTPENTAESRGSPIGSGPVIAFGAETEATIYQPMHRPTLGMYVTERSSAPSHARSSLAQHVSTVNRVSSFVIARIVEVNNGRAGMAK